MQDNIYGKAPLDEKAQDELAQALEKTATELPSDAGGRLRALCGAG